MRKHNPELNALSRVDWQFFCTLTFKKETSERVRLTMFFSWLRTIAENSGVHFKRVLWCLRTEKGEATGRLHFHCVIAGLPPHFVNRMTCMASMAIWEKHGGGMARVTQYSSALDGIDYILKGLDGSGPLATRIAGDYHELSKFGGSCDVTLSLSSIAYLDQRNQQGRRGAGYELWRQTRRPATRQSAVSNVPPSQRVTGTAITCDTSVHS